jgi:hypothetical protein
MVLRGCCAVRSLAREDRPIRLLMTTPRVGEGIMDVSQNTCR